MRKRTVKNTDEFSKRLRSLRKSRRLTMRETARLIDVPESTYRQWEYGQAILGEPYSFIAKAFNVTLDELFGVQDQEATIEGDFNRISSLKYS